uniref:Saposin B-type domain-containing protein n=1 Tax=Panagrolaimus sp. JU765 TaxID=591449 RepID=A0AC34QWA3_9BILA
MSAFCYQHPENHGAYKTKPRKGRLSLSSSLSEMNSKVVAILLICLIGYLQAQSDACSLCTAVVNGSKKDFNNNFTGVTVDQLKTDLKKQCNLNASGIEATVCSNIVSQKAPDLLKALQAGETTQQCCVQGGMC